MQIVIDIPERDYKDTLNGIFAIDVVREAVKKGVQLPKGHGRLIDADALLKKHPEFDTYPFPSTTINNAPPIIEADKEYKADGGMRNDTR